MIKISKKFKFHNSIMFTDNYGSFEISLKFALFHQVHEVNVYTEVQNTIQHNKSKTLLGSICDKKIAVIKTLQKKYNKYNVGLNTDHYSAQKSTNILKLVFGTDFIGITTFILYREFNAMNLYSKLYEIESNKNTKLLYDSLIKYQKEHQNYVKGYFIEGEIMAG